MRTNAPIMTHTYAPDRVGDQQVAILNDEGIDMSRICIGHSNDSTDLNYLEGLLESGVWLGMDRNLKHGQTPDWQVRTQIVKTLIDRGWGNRILMAHDYDVAIGLFTPEARAQRDADNPDAWLFISRHVLPYLKELGATDADIKTLMIDNPRRYIEGAFQV